MAGINAASKGTTQYNVTVEDPTGKASAEQLALVKMLVKAAGDHISQWLPGAGTIDVLVTLDPAVETANALTAFMQTPLRTVNGRDVYESVYAYEVRTGIDGNGSEPDMKMGVSADLAKYFLDSTPTTSADLPVDGDDFFGTALHELLHSLVLDGYRDEKNGQFLSNGQSILDSMVTLTDGKPFFTGTAAQAVYGGPVPLTPGNMYHYGETYLQPPHLLGGVMNGVNWTPGVRFGLSDLDLAMLQDVGLQISRAGDAQALVWGSTAADALAATAAAKLEGLGGNDALTGSLGDDELVGGAGNDVLDGGAGTDKAVFAGDRSTYTITRSGSSYTVSGADGADTLQNVEKIVFSDLSIDLSVKQKAQAISAAQLKTLVELYVAFFNRIPEAEGLGYWIGQTAAGKPLAEIADAFYSAALQYSSLTGYTSSMTNQDFVKLIYKNVLGRTDGGDPEGVAFWSNALASGTSRGELVSTMLGSAHTFKGHATFGWVADLLDNKATVAQYFAVDQGLGYTSAETSIQQGMAIAAAVTATSTSAAINLIGVPEIAVT